MKLPLPSDTQTILHVDNVLAKTSNLGLLFNKYVSVWSDDWTTEEKRDKDKVNLKAEFLNKTEKESFSIKQSKESVESLYKRQLSMIQGLKSSGWHVESFNAITDNRLIIGLGGASVIETGMTLHPLYGFPYLPGSGLKGLARAYAEIALETKPLGDEFREIFGSEDKDPRHVANNRQGKVFFIDGLPTTFPKLDLDIMNPHYGGYYRGEKDSKGNLIPPADYLNPVPVTFLAVASEQPFSFALFSRDEGRAKKAEQWLIGGLTELGAGGKTNVGYGYFRKVDVLDRVYTKTKESEVRQEDDSFLSRFEKVKKANTPKAVLDFLKSLRTEEMNFLRNISFQGMVSINIGLVSDLEGLGLLSDILKVVAEKMLEVIEPKKKWDEKKHEKYRKLRAMAGKEDIK
jgi:CRISPR-associated protein Cmr6